MSGQRALVPMRAAAFWFAVALVSVQCSHSVQAEFFSCTQSDLTCQSLGDLFYATAFGSRAGWRNESGWSSAAAGIPTSYCTFVGASCSGLGVLTSLCVIPIVLTSFLHLSSPSSRSNLAYQGLIGSIPSSMGSLTDLTSLCVNRPNVPLSFADALRQRPRSKFFSWHDSNQPGQPHSPYCAVRAPMRSPLPF